MNKAGSAAPVSTKNPLSPVDGKREIVELGGIKHCKERVFPLSTTHGAENHSSGPEPPFILESRTLMKSSSKPAPQTDLTLLVSLYAAEFALVLIGLALHKLGERPLAAWPPSNPSLAFLAGAGLLIVALAGSAAFT